MELGDLDQDWLVVLIGGAACTVGGWRSGSWWSLGILARKGSSSASADRLRGGGFGGRALSCVQLNEADFLRMNINKIKSIRTTKWGITDRKIRQTPSPT